jgi:hypothetical protein
MHRSRAAAAGIERPDAYAGGARDRFDKGRRSFRAQRTDASEEPEIELAAEEASFLRWLRADGGIGTRSGRNWMGNDIRLVELGYVEAWRDRAKPGVVSYKLAARGERALTRYDNAHRADRFALSRRPRRWH